MRLFFAPVSSPSPFPIIPNIFYDICKLNVFIFNEKQRKHQSSKLNLSNNWLSLVSIYKEEEKEERKINIEREEKGNTIQVFYQIEQ